MMIPGQAELLSAGANALAPSSPAGPRWARGRVPEGPIALLRRNGATRLVLRLRINILEI